jgi:hypothetical protein
MPLRTLGWSLNCNQLECAYPGSAENKANQGILIDDSRPLPGRADCGSCSIAQRRRGPLLVGRNGAGNAPACLSEVAETLVVDEQSSWGSTAGHNRLTVRRRRSATARFLLNVPCQDGPGVVCPVQDWSVCGTVWKPDGLVEGSSFEGTISPRPSGSNCQCSENSEEGVLHWMELGRDLEGNGTERGAGRCSGLVDASRSR